MMHLHSHSAPTILGAIHLAHNGEKKWASSTNSSEDLLPNSSLEILQRLKAIFDHTTEQSIATNTANRMFAHYKADDHLWSDLIDYDGITFLRLWAHLGTAEKRKDILKNLFQSGQSMQLRCHGLFQQLCSSSLDDVEKKYLFNTFADDLDRIDLAREKVFIQLFNSYYVEVQALILARVSTATRKRIFAEPSNPFLVALWLNTLCRFYTTPRDKEKYIGQFIEHLTLDELVSVLEQGSLNVTLVLPFLPICLSDQLFNGLAQHHTMLAISLINGMMIAEQKVRNYLFISIQKPKHRNRASRLKALALPSKQTLPITFPEIESLPAFVVGMLASETKHQKWLAQNAHSFGIDQIIAISRGIRKERVIPFLEESIALFTPDRLAAFVENLSPQHLKNLLEHRLTALKKSQKRVNNDIVNWQIARTNYDNTPDYTSQKSAQIQMLTSQLETIGQQLKTALAHPLNALLLFKKDLNQIGPFGAVHQTIMVLRNRCSLIKTWQNELAELESPVLAGPLKKTPVSSEYACLFEQRTLKELGFKHSHSLAFRGIKFNEDFALLGVSPADLAAVQEITKELKALFHPLQLAGVNRCLSYRSMRSTQSRQQSIRNLLHSLSKSITYTWNDKAVGALFQKIKAAYPNDPHETRFYELRHLPDAQKKEELKMLGYIIDFVCRHQLFAQCFRYLHQADLPKFWKLWNERGISALSEIPGVETKDPFSLETE